MNVLILHDPVPPEARADEADALVQAAAVAEALRALGHEAETLALTLDLEATRGELEQRGPELVFNLVEAPGGHGRLIHVAPALLEALAIPFTGASSTAQFSTSNKLVAKRMLRDHGLPTASWIESVRQAGAEATAAPGEGTYIIKSVWEHASVGLDEDSIIETDSPGELQRAIEARLPQLGGEGFAEAYIDGREFNLGLLAAPSPDGTDGAPAPEVLPRAEIIFEGYAASKPRIVGYRAKWASDSFEYHHTPPSYDFGAGDAPLLDELTALALECWHLFDLRGHARVDFRVDERGQPWILEVNANPCLSLDAGFAAALKQADIPFSQAIARIMDDTLRLSRPPAAALR